MRSPSPCAPVRIGSIVLAFAIIFAATVAAASPIVPAIAVQAPPCDARVLVLPGEAPLAPPCTPAIATAAEPAVVNPGEILVSGRTYVKTDPLVAVNAATYKAVAVVDEALVEPIAKAYGKGLPAPLRDGLSNVFGNLREPVVFLNDMLQLRPRRALKTLGRFVVNSTAGIAGVLDVAKKKPFHLPRRINGFANTLGYYGIGSGPFLVLPVVGATTLRDVLGGAVDTMLLPNTVGKPFTAFAYRASAFTITALDGRLEADAEIARARASGDPYATMREFYISRRAAEIAALKASGNGVVPATPK